MPPSGALAAPKRGVKNSVFPVCAGCRRLSRLPGACSLGQDIAGNGAQSGCPETLPAITTRLPGRHLEWKPTDRPIPSNGLNSWSAVYSGVQAACQVPHRDFSVAGKKEGTSRATEVGKIRPSPSLTRH